MAADQLCTIITEFGLTWTTDMPYYHINIFWSDRALEIAMCLWLEIA